MNLSAANEFLDSLFDGASGGYRSVPHGFPTEFGRRAPQTAHHALGFPFQSRTGFQMGVLSRLKGLFQAKPAVSDAPPWINAAWINAAEKAQQRGVKFIREQQSGITVAKYEKDGRLDYETYRQIQTIGNKAKLDWVSTTEDVVKLVSNHAAGRLGTVNRILCHGTRNAAEQKWFQKEFPKAEILGTEISDTASQFPMTIMWDFHELHDGWEGHWDVVYSNSWDHALDHTKMFKAWARSLRRNGIMYLEHTPDHELVDHLDLFGANAGALKSIVQEAGVQYMETLPVDDEQKSRQVLVFLKP